MSVTKKLLILLALQEVKEDVTCHQPELATLFQAADELMAGANDPSDTTCDKLQRYKEDTQKRLNSLEEEVSKRRGQLDKALEKAEEFRAAFKQEKMWLNSADDQLKMEWSPRGLPDKCKEEIEQHKVRCCDVVITIVTGFWKTNYCIYTQKLKSIFCLYMVDTLINYPESPSTIQTVDCKVCFYRWLFADVVKPQGSISWP